MDRSKSESEVGVRLIEAFASMLDRSDLTEDQMKIGLTNFTRLEPCMIRALKEHCVPGVKPVNLYPDEAAY